MPSQQKLETVGAAVSNHTQEGQKMHYSTWINGQHQQVGAASQAATQYTYCTMRNQQSGSVTNPVTMSVQPPQSANVTFWDGTNTRQMSNCQTSVAPHQMAFFSQPNGEKNSNYFTLQNVTVNTQSGKTFLPFNNRFKVATQQHFHHSSAQNSLTQTPGMNNSNATYHLRDMAPYWNQPVNGTQSRRAQDGNAVSDRQCYRVQDTVHQNGNRESMNAISAFSATGTGTCNSSSVSVAAPNRQIHAQNPRQIQDRLPTSFPPSYAESILFCRNNGNLANSLSKKQNCHVSRLNQETQQNAPQLTTIHNPGGEATPTVNSNTHSRQFKSDRFHSNVNEVSTRYSEICRIEQSLQKSYSAESNQTMQTLISNTTDPLLPKNNFHSVKSGAQPIVNMPPQQNSVSDGFSVTTAGEGSGNCSIKPYSALINRNLVGSSHEGHAPPLHASLSPQKNKPQCFVANSQEIPEVLTSVKSCDGSTHSSPGRTGARAVAVVQPLSQEGHQSGSKPSSCNTSNQLGMCSTTDESLRNSADLCSSSDVAKKQQGELGEGINVYTQNANQTRSSEFPVKRAAASSTCVPSSKSSEPCHLLKKLLFQEYIESKIKFYMQADQKVATASQQLVTSKVPVRQNTDKDASDMPADLVSIPTTSWTKDMLTNLIQDEEKSYMFDYNAKYNFVFKLIYMFWDDNREMLISKLKKNWYRHLIEYVHEFCDKNVTKDSVILSQLKHGFRDVLKNYHVLKEKEVYSAPLYKSLWLNVNQQLDDIDKEFGFPWPLKHGLNTFETSSQSGQGEAVNSILPQTERNMPLDPLVKPVLETVGSVEEKQTSTLTTSNQIFPPKKTDGVESSDPYYSFEIQVLPPEEAKRIYQQVQSEMPQSMDMESQPEEVTNRSEEDDVDEVTDVALRESVLEDESFSPVEEVCCIARLLQTVGGSSLSKCQCKKNQSQTYCADEIPDKEGTTPQNEKLCLIKSETSTKEATQVDSGEDTNTHIIFSKPELCSGQISDLTEDGNTHLYVANSEMNISHISINDSQSSVSENEDKEMNTTAHSPLRNSDISEKEMKKVFNSKVTSQMSNNEEDSVQAELASANVMESPLESQEKNVQSNVTSPLQTTSTPHGECETAERKRKTLSSIDRFFPKVNKSKKCKLFVAQDSKPASSDVDYKNGFVEVTDSNSPATNLKTVELVLFGSAPQEKCVLPDSGRSPVSSPKGLSKAGQMPPRFLAVNVSTVKTKDDASPGTYSVKQRLHEDWRRSFPPTKIKQNGKLKTIKHTLDPLSGVRFKNTETAGSTNPQESQASSETRTCNKNAKRTLGLKKGMTRSQGVKIREDKTKMDAATLGPPADEERSNARREMCVVMPPKDRIFLKMNLSPKKSEHRSSGRKETARHPVTD